MLEDLIFKGKNLDEALAKASNFFGADKSGLRYEIIEDSPEGEVWIKLTEHPVVSAHESEKPAVMPESQQTDPRSKGDRQQHRPTRQPTSRGGRWRAGSRFASQPPQDQGRRSNKRNRGAEGRWERTPPNLDGLTEVEKEAYGFVADLLNRMRFHLDVQPVLDQSRLIFNIDGPDRNLLLNKKGSVLTSIQYLVNKIFMNREAKPQKIFVDSQGYRVAREEELREIAFLGAEKVRNTNREYCLSPMNPYERRLIHLALKDDKEVTTISRGEGYIKRVSIVPKSQIKEGTKPAEHLEQEEEDF